MTYMLVAFFVATGQQYTEMKGLSLQECAGRAAMRRWQTEELFHLVGEVQYRCKKEAVKR
jgi:hypothetical protein